MMWTSHIRVRAVHSVKKVNCRRISAGSLENSGWRVVLFGSDEFSLKHLRSLHAERTEGKCISHLEVATSEPKFVRHSKKIHHSPVAEYCRHEGLPLHYWPVEDISSFDLGVVVSFGHMIPRKLIKCFPLGILNVHPSLLPRWRGAAPIPHTILAGDAVTGVTIMRIRPDRFDAGPIVSQEEVPVPEGSTTDSLAELLSRRGSQMLVEVLRDLRGYLENEQPQEEEGVTKAPKLKPSQGLINWEMTSMEIDRLYRAVHGRISIKASWRDEDIRLLEMVPLHENLMYSKDFEIPQPALGLMTYHMPSATLQIRCQDTFVGFRSVGFGHRKNMSAKEFHNGLLSNHRAGDRPVLEGGTEKR